jgi:hypothetical protein
MFDYAAATNIDRLAAAHQRYLDDEAAEQDLQEAEEEAISNTPSLAAESLDNLDASEWRVMNLLIGKLISQYQYHGDERDQGILDTSQEIYDLCQRPIAERATVNHQRAVRSAASGLHFPQRGAEK